MTQTFGKSSHVAAAINQATQLSVNLIPNAAAVAEFKGPQVFGVVRIVQDGELALIEANFSGLSAGLHGWSINEYGDVTRGAASTGKIYASSPQANNKHGATDKLALGDLGVLLAGANGKAEYRGFKPMLNVADLAGRSVVLYVGPNKDEDRIVAAVIAWSSRNRATCKSLCACDGTSIWDYAKEY